MTEASPWPCLILATALTTAQTAVATLISRRTL